MVVHKNIHIRISWINVGAQMVHHMFIPIIMDLSKILCSVLYTVGSKRQTKTLETTFFKKLFHNMSDATKQNCASTDAV